jgi:predicted RNase H-like nuclease (RuvC/YqgF family)
MSERSRVQYKLDQLEAVLEGQREELEEAERRGVDTTRQKMTVTNLENEVGGLQRELDSLPED